MVQVRCLGFSEVGSIRGWCLDFGEGWRFLLRDGVSVRLWGWCVLVLVECLVFSQGVAVGES